MALAAVFVAGSSAIVATFYLLTLRAVGAFVLESLLFVTVLCLAYVRAGRQSRELSQQYEQYADQAVAFQRQSVELQEQAMQVITSSALTEAIVQASPVAIIALDQTLNVTAWNAGAERLFGWTADEILGRRYPIIPDEGWTEFLVHHNRLLAHGTISDERHDRLRKDGSTVAVSVSGAVLRNVNGDASGVVIVATDLTERERLETELRQAQKMEAIGELASGVAHDFNNLLTVILSYSQLLLADAPTGSALANGLREIGDAATRATGLTRQLLSFSRSQLLAPSELNLNEVVESVTPMLGLLLGSTVHLDVTLAPDLWSCFADRGQIEQVIMNLAVNARDSMPGGGSLSIATGNTVVSNAAESAERGMAAGRYVMLRVRDGGVGMDESTRSQVFEPFFTTKPLGEGTGLGLATVHGIVRESEGVIQVTSVLGQGSEFIVYLPVTPQAAPVAPPEVLAPQPPTVESADDGPERPSTILVVDDLPSIRMLSRTILERAGHTVLEAEDGKDALQRLAAAGGGVDLVISDIEMPHMGGLELMGRLGELYPQIPIMLVSGYSVEMLLRRGVLSSRVAFLEKPYTPRALTDAVAEVQRKVRHARRPTAIPVASRPLVAIVDDTELNRVLAGALLEDSCAVFRHAGGETTVDDLAARLPALILLDIDMPDLNGFELLVRIRQSPALRGTPVIAFTARSTPSDRKDFEEAGFDGYIAKPIADFEAFRLAVDGYMQAPSPAHDASGSGPLEQIVPALV